MRLSIPVQSLVILLSLQASAADLWISPTGSDDNDGSIERPLASLQAALARDPAAHVLVLPGTYSLTQPIRLDASHSGAVIEAASAVLPVFSGGRRISGFTPAANGLWRASADFRFEQLWVNGRRATRARTPNQYWLYVRKAFGYGFDPVTGQPLDLSRRSFGAYPGDLAPLANLSPEELNQVEVMGWQSWAISRLKVSRFNPQDSTIFFTGPGQYPFLNFGPNQRYHIENYFDALDAPGEWFHSLDGTVYYKPRPGEDISTAEAVAPVISQFLIIDGAQRVTLRGLRFLYSGYRLPADRHTRYPVLRLPRRRRHARQRARRPSRRSRNRSHRPVRHLVPPQLPRFLPRTQPPPRSRRRRPAHRRNQLHPQ